MSISFDGTTLIWDGEVRITNFTDPDTGVVTLTLTPAGGVGQLPALLDGAPGLPPVIDNINTFEHDPDEALPPSTFDLVSPGGPGEASHYVLNLHVHKGAQGTAGTNASILTASDVEGTPQDGYILQYSAADQKLVWVASRIGGLYVATTIAGTSGNQAARTLSSITVPPQPNAYRPMPFAQTQVVGTAATLVHLIARVNDAVNGDQCGICYGLPGTDRPILIPAYGAGLSTTYAKVAAGTQAVFYLQAEQQQNVTDSWTTAGNYTTFAIKCDPA